MRKKIAVTVIGFLLLSTCAAHATLIKTEHLPAFSEYYSGADNVPMDISVVLFSWPDGVTELFSETIDENSVGTVFTFSNGDPNFQFVAEALTTYGSDSPYFLNSPCDDIVDSVVVDLTGYILSEVTLTIDDFYIGNTGGYNIAKNTLSFYGPSPVPEPVTILLFGTGLVGLAGARFRKKF